MIRQPQPHWIPLHLRQATIISTVQPDTREKLAVIWGNVFTALPDDTNQSFLSTAQRLAKIGVQRYRLDLLANTVTSYIGTATDTYVFHLQTPSSGERAGTVEWDYLKIGEAIGHMRRYTTYPVIIGKLIHAGATDVHCFVDEGKTLFMSGKGDLLLERGIPARILSGEAPQDWVHVINHQGEMAAFGG